MGLFSSLLGGDEWRSKPAEEKAADISRHKAYKKALDQHYEWAKKHPGQLEETPTYNQLNGAVNDTDQDVPWWRR